MKIIQEFIADIKNGENIDVYLTVLVCTVVVILDLIGVVQLSIITSAILLTLALLLVSILSIRKSLDKFENAIERLGVAGIEILDMKVGFPQQIAQRARAAKKFILDTDLNREIRRVSTINFQAEYYRIRDERVLKGEIAFKSVEVIFHKKHLESVIRRLLRFEGCEFYIRHYDPPPQAIPVLHIMSFDDEHIYLGGFYPSDPSTEEKAIYVRSKEMSELIKEYWQVLWFRAKPLSEGGVINWDELKRIGTRLGLSESEFDEMEGRIRSEIGREKNSSIENRPTSASS